MQLFVCSQWKAGPIFMWFCICIVFVREGIPCCGEIVSRWDQWSACSSVNAVVHSHFCTSQEMQQLILPHWARASQRCKCGHSSMEPLTSVGKSEIIEQPALSFLLKECEICIGSFMFFIFPSFYYRKKKHPQGCFLYHLACKSKKKKWSETSQRVTDLVWISMLAFQTRSYLVRWSQGILQSGQTTLVIPAENE